MTAIPSITSGKNSTQAGTILVIDDQPTNLSVAVNALEDYGFNVLIASSGEIGVERAKYAHPDIILLDVLMPGIDGFETCRRLKSDPDIEMIPVVFMTALSSCEDKVKGFEAGAVDYVTKPIQVEEVVARVNLHLKLYLLTQKLEQQVEQRTAELNQALQQLQESQLQLVQSEKMSALGQLMAGVTHEINNPIGFVSGNLNYAKDYFADLTEHLQLYQKKFPDPGAEIENHAVEIELDYLLEDIPTMLESMQSGMKRIRDISTSMRVFSRADKDQKTAFNLDEIMDGNLLLLKYRIKEKENRPEIDIIKHYGDLPKIKGFPGQLNQVFMNIIANAIDMFDQMSESSSFEDLKPRCKIYISTEIVPDNSQVLIKIKDQGCGMTEEVKAKVFEHLFTTKPVGKGTGLGLSIARQIVEEKHGGTLSCHSEVGQGTEFVITLPL